MSVKNPTLWAAFQSCVASSSLLGLDRSMIGMSILLAETETGAQFVEERSRSMAELFRWT